MKSSPPAVRTTLGFKPTFLLRLSRPPIRASNRAMAPEAVPEWPATNCVNLLIGFARNQESLRSPASLTESVAKGRGDGNLDCRPANRLRNAPGRTRRQRQEAAGYISNTVISGRQLNRIGTGYHPMPGFT